MTAASDRFSMLTPRERYDGCDAWRPRVLDSFAGGGSIPLEAARLGCDSYAVRSQPDRAPRRARYARISIDLTLAADRNGLFAAWPALANLADMAGNITVAVRAECASGLDKHTLEHAVLEPLRELGLIGDDSGS